jgi:hypothetical protein
VTTAVSRHLSETGPSDESPPGWLDLVMPVSNPRISRFGDIWVWTADAEFDRWRGRAPGGLEFDCRKRAGLVLGPDDSMSCAEIEVVRRVRSREWTAGWLATCGRRNDEWRDLMLRVRTPKTSVLPPVRLTPKPIGTILEAGGRSGFPDVVAWREPTRPIFVELKGPGDGGENQVPWLRSVWGRGLMSHSDFLLLQWSFRPEVR